MQLEMTLDGIPPTADEKSLFLLIQEWGSIRFDDMRYQMRWPFDRCSAALCGLIDKHIVSDRKGPVGDFFIKPGFNRKGW